MSGMGSEQIRIPQPQQQERRWGGCLGAFPCFGSQKGGKRIVPASRIPEGNAAANQPNRPQAIGLANPGTALVPSLLAPPSSPASFTNSALPSTAQSPSCFLSLSANSPGGPSSTMYATGPYAHETQLVSPPVFSTFTTEPSTAPLTPPPELAHLTTPSSPDVPYAQFLSSSRGLKGAERSSYLAGNDLQANYPLYPGSPSSSLRSPVSRISSGGLSSSFPEREFHSQWDPSASPQSGKYHGSGSDRLYGQDNASSSAAAHDTNFFCPATFAEFYLDHNPPFPQTGGRLSVSKDSDVAYNGSSGYQNRQNNRSPMQDADEIEAYRASFGFSADEIIVTNHYVEISDPMDDSFSMTPFASNNSSTGETLQPVFGGEEQKAEKTHITLLTSRSLGVEPDPLTRHARFEVSSSCNNHRERKPWRPSSDAPGLSTPINHTDDENILWRMRSSRSCRKYHSGLSSSDAEIEYRRGRSLREGRRDFAWRR